MFLFSKFVSSCVVDVTSMMKQVGTNVNWKLFSSVLLLIDLISVLILEFYFLRQSFGNQKGNTASKCFFFQFNLFSNSLPNLFFQPFFSTFFFNLFFQPFFSTFFFNLFFQPFFSTFFFQPVFSTSFFNLFFSTSFFNIFFLDVFSQPLLSLFLEKKLSSNLFLNKIKIWRKDLLKVFFKKRLKRGWEKTSRKKRLKKEVERLKKKVEKKRLKKRGWEMNLRKDWIERKKHLPAVLPFGFQSLRRKRNSSLTLQ